MNLILASTSPYRRELLERLGVSFSCENPFVDEAPIQRAALSVQEKAEKLALLKAQAVVRKFPQAIVIGGDQIACLGEEVLSKPGSRAKAIEQLGKLSGKTHRLVTSFALIGSGQEIVETMIAELTMRSLTTSEIESYVDRDQPFDCAGSYKLEKSGITLFSQIVCVDWTAIQGLPLMRVGELVRGWRRD